MRERVAVSLDGTYKSYSGRVALAGVSFRVVAGTCFGLLGPNGAGKSTIMRLLSARACPDPGSRGKVQVFGLDPERHELAIKRRIGVVPQEDILDQDLNVAENLLVSAILCGLRKTAAQKRIAELLEFMELRDRMSARIKELSGGMKRRLSIARALLHEPELLLLDEPTTGLDPQVRHAIWDKLRHMQRKGLTLLLSTHYMEEAYQLCEDIVILDHGSVLLSGDPRRLVETHIERYVLEFTSAEVSAEVVSGFVRDGYRVDDSAGVVRIYSNDERLLGGLVGTRTRRECQIRECTLEDLFLKTTGRALNAVQ